MFNFNQKVIEMIKLSLISIKNSEKGSNYV